MSKKNTPHLYKSYVFKDKDPVIDRLRTIVADEGVKYSEIAEGSGVSSTTLYNWFEGATLKPQFCTVMAVARSLGYDMEIVPKRSGQRSNVVNLRKVAVG